MSTRALFSFEDADGSYHVYKHDDGDPQGAAEAIMNALEYAWPLPMFEADEFAAAFVAANKPHWKDSVGGVAKTTEDEARRSRGGGVRLTMGATWEEAAPADVVFHYTITFPQGLVVRAESVTYHEDPSGGGNDKWDVTDHYTGTMSGFIDWSMTA